MGVNFAGFEENVGNENSDEKLEAKAKIGVDIEAYWRKRVSKTKDMTNA